MKNPKFYVFVFDEMCIMYFNCDDRNWILSPRNSSFVKISYFADAFESIP